MESMTTSQDRHHYQATFHGGADVSGGLVCPYCGAMNLHPTGHARPIESDAEYGPSVGVVAFCECGHSVEIRMGNYKGDFGMDVVKLGW